MLIFDEDTDFYNMHIKICKHTNQLQYQLSFLFIKNIEYFKRIKLNI